MCLYAKPRTHDSAPFARPAPDVSDFDPSDYHLPVSRLEGGAHSGYIIDTCSIDKSSSAELSEALNSMYSWYQGAVEYLA